MMKVILTGAVIDPLNLETLWTTIRPHICTHLFSTEIINAYQM